MEDHNPILEEDNSFLKLWVKGQYDPEKYPHLFKYVPQNLTHSECVKTLQMLHKDVLEAFNKMHNAAKQDNIELLLISTLRNYDVQRAIWENKFKNIKLQNPSFEDEQVVRQIMTYSAMPTTSRHHWGTDLDINSLEPEYFESGKGLTEYQWLQKNAPRYGFQQTYSSFNNGSRKCGYNLEDWHWSYMPVSKKLLEFYRDNITYDDIEGFSGSTLAKKVRSIEDYVLSINSACLNWRDQE